MLVKELQALSMNVELLDQDGQTIDMDALAKESEKEERRINSNIRNLIGEGAAESVVNVEAIGLTTHTGDDRFDD